MNKNQLTAKIISIASYTVLIGAWALVLFSMISFTFEAAYFDDFLFWYENNFGNIGFLTTSTFVLVVLTLMVLYVIVMQERNAKRK